MKPVTIFDSGRMLASKKLWIPTECLDGCKDSVSYTDFWTYCTLSGLTCSDRKIKELWNGWLKLGVARRVNQRETLVFDLGKFRAVMATQDKVWAVSL